MRYLDDVCHTLEVSATELQDKSVCLLTLKDLLLLKSVAANIHGDGFEDLTAMLSEGFVAETMVDGGLIGIARVSALTYVYTDIGVATLAPLTGCDFATAAASIVV